VDTENGERRTERAFLYLKVDTLAKDGKFKRSVLEEVSGGDGKLLLKPLVRDYVTGLIRVQQRVRTELRSLLSEDDALLESLVERFRIVDRGGALGLNAVAQRGDGTYADKIGVSTSFIERRRLLEQKNSGAGDLGKLVVTSE